LPTPTDIVLVIDRSASMADNNRMALTKQEAKTFVDNLLVEGSNIRIAVVTFGKTNTLVSDFRGFDGKQALMNAIGTGNGIGGFMGTGNTGIAILSGDEAGTNIQAGLYRARQLLESSNATNKAILLLGDGEPTFSYQVTGATGITFESCSYSFLQQPLHQANCIYDDLLITACDYSSVVGEGNSMSIARNKCYSIECDHGANSYTTFPATHDIPTYYEAELVKSSGIDIYTIALVAGVNGTDILKNIAGSPADTYSLNAVEDIGKAFDYFAFLIKYS